MVTFATAESDGKSSLESIWSHDRCIEARMKVREAEKFSDLGITESSWFLGTYLSIPTLVQNDAIALAARRPLRLNEPPRRAIRDT